jgi:xylan 1,4-beta-xylosidase
MTTSAGRDAREDWERRVYRRTDGGDRSGLELPPPRELTAVPALGHVALTWAPVDGAAGYVISRAETLDGPFVPIDHGNSDVLEVPDPWYADARVEAGKTYHYRVQAAAGAGVAPGPAAGPVSAAPALALTAPVRVAVDASRVTGTLRRIWEMVGSERLSQLFLDRDEAGNPVGAQFREALARAHSELGVRRVRAHAIFHDDVAVFRWPAGGDPEYDFTGVDRIVDELLAVGVRPVLELGFLPRDLASDPTKTIFQYRGIISPPKDWSVWGELNRRLAAHLVDRYGVEEVAAWGFEVWNEPNLEVFWTGTKADYLRLYAEAARAVKSVDERLLVGGPATAAGEWVEDLCAFCEQTGTPLDFLSTHTYGNAPIDVRPVLCRHGFDNARIWWTEWGVGHTHFAPIHDTAYGAPFVLRGLKSAQERADALAYWVVSDHFEELGRPPRLLHGGFGLLTVGNLRKPRWWAVALAAQLGDELIDSRVTGDGARGLVEAWAARGEDGRIDVLVWNACPDASLFRGVPALDRSVRVSLDGLPAGRYAVRLARVDNEHSSIGAYVDPDCEWPDEAGWARLRAHDVLDERLLDPVQIDDGTTELDVVVPMPGVVRVRLEPLG